MDFIRRHPVLTFVGSCLLPVHGILWPALWLGASPEALQPLKLPFAILPTASAVWITYCLEGPQGVEFLFRRILKRGVHWIWIVPALGLFSTLALAALLIRYRVDGFFPPLSDFASPGTVLLLSIPLLLFPGFAEEIGWRGFMQTRLQRSWPPILAALGVGIVWSAWHYMDFLMGNWSGGVTNQLIFLAYITGISGLIGWIFIRARESILVAMLAHYGANAVNVFIPLWKDHGGSRLPPMMFIGLVWLTLLVVVVFDRRLRRST